MKLIDYLAAIRSANSIMGLEQAIQAPYVHNFTGRTWARICKVRDQRAVELCREHPLGKYVPIMTKSRITVCDETFARSYVAGERVVALLQESGFSKRAANRILGSCGSYQHRTIAIIEEALSGRIPDPELNVLKFTGMGSGPVQITVEENESDPIDSRATMPCECSGTLFDWGGGYSEGFSFINWRCNCCARTYTEYTSPERFRAIRQPRIRQAAPQQVDAVGA